MAHTLPPVQCGANTPSFTDTVTANTTVIKPVHITELRTKLNDEFTRRVKSTGSYTDPTLTANTTIIRAVHVSELRTECSACKNGRSEAGYCPEDNSGCMDFTDPTITALSTVAKAVHLTQLRTKVTALWQGCICETEQCEYCSDCGYKYQAYACPCQKGCYCDNSKYSGGCTHNYYYWVYNCGSINTGGTHPYKSYAPAVTWDGTVPWNWGDGIPGGSLNWASYWTCKCNPYTW